MHAGTQADLVDPDIGPRHGGLARRQELDDLLGHGPASSVGCGTVSASSRGFSPRFRSATALRGRLTPPADARDGCRVALSFFLNGSRPRHRGQIGGFLMEAPTTSATLAITMIAPKRAVMIDNLAWAVSDVSGTSPEDPDDPSLAHPARPRQRTRTRSLSADRGAPESAPITCSACRLTYLPTAVPSASRRPTGWVCDGCQQNLG